MKITEHMHAVRIPFQIPVAPERLVDRDVHAFLVLTDRITLIDSGVAGTEAILFDYIRQQGRDPGDISLLILSHSHPDHVGAAQAVRAATGCRIAAHAGEKDWIEDTERQFRERPVPGFHTLVGGPVAVDQILSDGDSLDLGDGVTAAVRHTSGHSRGSISLSFAGEKVLFTGDAVPLPGDLPIYENIADCAASIKSLREYNEIDALLSSWEPPVQGREAVMKRMDDGLAWLRRIHAAVLNASRGGIEDPMDLCRRVVADLGLPPFAAMPLTAKAFASSLAAEKNGPLF